MNQVVFWIESDGMIDGAVALEDVGHPWLQRPPHFIKSNCDNSVLNFEPRPASSGACTFAKAIAEKLLNPLVRDNRSPSAVSISLQGVINYWQLIAFRSDCHNARLFDYLVLR